MPIDFKEIALKHAKAIASLPKRGVSTLVGFETSYRILFDYIKSHLVMADFVSNIVVESGVEDITVTGGKDVFLFVNTSNVASTRNVTIENPFDGQQITIKDIGNFGHIQTITLDGETAVSAMGDSSRWVRWDDDWIRIY